MASYALSELVGRKARIEVREGRRWHRMVYATLEVERDQLFAVFASSHREHYPEPIRIRVPEKQMDHFSRAAHAEYEFKLESVLYRVAHQSDDSSAGLQPPIIVTQAEIDAARNEPA